MDDIAAFKLDGLPDVTFTVTRSTDSGGRPEGSLTFTARREHPEILCRSGGSGPRAPQTDTPRIPGGKVPFVFRTLPGYIFYALRCDTEIDFGETPLGVARRMPGWVRITYYGPGDDEERELCGFEGPES